MAYQPVLAPEHRRPETNSFVTYPEWLIVHVYEDYAAVSRSAEKAAFPYFSSTCRRTEGKRLVVLRGSAPRFVATPYASGA